MQQMKQMKEDAREEKAQTLQIKVECFICEEEDDISNLREGMTNKLGDSLKRCVRTLNHGKLLAKLSAGDVVSLEVRTDA